MYTLCCLYLSLTAINEPPLLLNCKSCMIRTHSFKSADLYPEYCCKAELCKACRTYLVCLIYEDGNFMKVVLLIHKDCNFLGVFRSLPKDAHSVLWWILKEMLQMQLPEKVRTWCIHNLTNLVLLDNNPRIPTSNWESVESTMQK